MITRLEKQDLAEQITMAYEDLESLLMRNIIRHIRAYDQPIDSDDWLLEMMGQLGKLNQENLKLIARNSVQPKAIERMLRSAADLALSRVEPGLDELEREGIIKKAVPVKRSKHLENAIETVFAQAQDTMNLCNTNMLYMAQESYKELARNVVQKAKEIEQKQEFLDTLGRHAVAEAAGAESRQQALESAIREFNEKGIPAFVDKKGRKWSPEAYVGMTLRATAGSVSTEAMMARMNDRGLSLIQISTHPGARPKCAKDQGKIFDRNNGRGYTTDTNGKKIPFYPWRESSYGEPDGILGINCGHHGVPFIPGISRERYFPTEDFKENDKLYRQMQTQRSFEREIRKHKRECMLLDEAGQEEAFQRAAVKLKAKEKQLDHYMETHPKLIRRRDREKVIGYSRGTSARAIAANKKHEKDSEKEPTP